jgi:Na+-translocating ferredoxin:NAD+ oxidoreductase subunit E
MSTDTISPTQRFINGILPENPVYRQLLGMCPVLAVTNSLNPALTMAAATTFVLVCANIMTSLMRHLLKPHLRILVFTLTIATFVTVADKLLAAYLFQMSKQLGPYVPLIIVNCLIISRCEACSSKEGLIPSIADAAGQGLGFTIALASLAFVRELLGMGSLFGFQVLPSAWPNWGILVLPPGAFLTLGVLLGTVNWWGGRKKNA